MLLSKGGPFRGSVDVIRNTVVDGHTGAALDNMYDDSQLLSICRSWPAMRSLQPTGHWNDGLNLPFIYLRCEHYLEVSIGQLDDEAKACAAFDGLLDSDIALTFEVCEVSASKRQTWTFCDENPYVEQITFVLPPELTIVSLCVRIGLRASGTAELDVSSIMQSADSEFVCVQLADCETHISLGALNLRVRVLDSADFGEPHERSQLHPLAGHCAGRRPTLPEPATGTQKLRNLSRDLKEKSSDLFWKASSWATCGDTRPAWSLACQHRLQTYLGLYEHTADSFRVPGVDDTTVEAADGEATESEAADEEASSASWRCSVDMCAPPPVKHVTAFYGVNVPTVRTWFLRHRAVYHAGGRQDRLYSPFELDSLGNTDGVRTLHGRGFETNEVQQVRPDTNEPFYRSGDGTVPYQSLRVAATWQSESCNAAVFELPGCGKILPGWPVVPY